MNLERAKSTSCFNINWQDCGHCRMNVVNADTLKELISTDGLAPEILNSPYIVDGGFKPPEESVLSKACDRFNTAFETRLNAAKTKESMTQAPMQEIHGSELLQPLWETAIPKRLCVETQAVL